MADFSGAGGGLGRGAVGGSVGHVDAGGGRGKETFVRVQAARIKAPLGTSAAVPNIFAQQLTLPGQPGEPSASYLPTDVTGGSGEDTPLGTGTSRNQKYRFSRRESLLLAS